MENLSEIYTLSPKTKNLRKQKSEGGGHKYSPLVYPMCCVVRIWKRNGWNVQKVYRGNSGGKLDGWGQGVESPTWVDASSPRQSIQAAGADKGKRGQLNREPARSDLESVVGGQHFFGSAVGLQGFCGVDILRQLRFASHQRALFPLVMLQLSGTGSEMDERGEVRLDEECYTSSTHRVFQMIPICA